LLAFAACLLWAVYSLTVRGIAARYSSAFITRKTFFYGILTIVPYNIAVGDVPSADVLCRGGVVANLLFLSVVASWLCYLAWAWSIKRLGAITTTNYVYVNPVSTIVFAWIILQEILTPWFFLGTLLILSGLFVCNRN